MNNNNDLNDNKPIEDDDDFPEYANEQNKELNEIVISFLDKLFNCFVEINYEKIKEKRRLIQDISRKIEEKSDRVKVLSDHLKNVQQELLHT